MTASRDAMMPAAWPLAGSITSRCSTPRDAIGRAASATELLDDARCIAWWPVRRVRIGSVIDVALPFDAGWSAGAGSTTGVSWDIGAR